MTEWTNLEDSWGGGGGGEAAQLLLGGGGEAPQLILTNKGGKRFIQNSLVIPAAKIKGLLRGVR